MKVAKLKVAKLTDTLEQRESVAVSAAISEGRLDPREGEFREVFHQGGDRRYIEDFIKLSYESLVSNQVGVVEVDKVRAKEEVLPLLQKDGLVFNPIVVKSLPGGKYKIEAGHHRAYACDILGWEIPAFVVSPFYNPTGKSSIFSERKARIQSNKRANNKQYKMVDTEREYHEAFADDPTFEGLNPSGQPLRRKSEDCFDIDDFLDDFFPGWFEHEGTRTKIHKLCMNKKNRQQIVEITPSDVTSSLANLGWDTGLKKGRSSKDSRLSFTEHICGKSLVLIADSNGNNAKGKILGLMEKYHLDNAWRKLIKQSDIKEVKVLGRIYDQDGSTISDPDKLRHARLSFSQLFECMNKLLRSTKTPFKITTLEMMKQSKSPTDMGQTFNF